MADPKYPWLDKVAPVRASDLFPNSSEGPAPSRPTAPPPPWDEVSPSRRVDYDFNFGGTQLQGQTASPSPTPWSGEFTDFGGDQLEHQTFGEPWATRPKRRLGKSSPELGSGDTVTELTRPTDSALPEWKSAVNAPRVVGINEWRDRLLQGSWRGVRFEIESHTIPIGRRATVHEFPQRDEVFVEDSGRQPRYHKITAFILGDDYDIQRNELIRALEFQGPGELVHPYLGRRQCHAIPPCSMTESVGEQRIARFEMNFVDATQDLGPIVAKDYTSQARTSAEAAVESSTLWHDVTEAVIDGRLLVYRQAYEAYKDDLNRTITVLLGATFASDLLDDVENITEVVGAVSDLRRLVTALITTAPRLTVPGLGDAEEIEAATALTSWVRTVIIERAVGLVVSTEYSSYDDAVFAATSVADQIRVDEETTTDANLYQWLVNLRIQLLQAIFQIAQRLPRERDLVLNTVVPAIVLAYSLYEHPDRDTDIVRRNNIANPNFVTGRLKVLSA